MGPERGSETFRTEEFLRRIQPEEKQELERLFPLHGKDVRVRHRGIFAHQNYEVIWHVELTDVWHIALGRSQTAPLDPHVIMYQIKVTTESRGAVELYLEAPHLTLRSQRSEDTFLAEFQRTLSDPELEGLEVIRIPAVL